MENSTIRNNLINEAGYSPYCGNENCKYHWPRTKWDVKKEQFTCGCGWISEFPADFIERYKKKWNK